MGAAFFFGCGDEGRGAPFGVSFGERNSSGGQGGQGGLGGVGWGESVKGVRVGQGRAGQGRNRSLHFYNFSGFRVLPSGFLDLNFVCV